MLGMHQEHKDAWVFSDYIPTIFWGSLVWGSHFSPFTTFMGALVGYSRDLVVGQLRLKGDGGAWHRASRIYWLLSQLNIQIIGRFQPSEHGGGFKMHQSQVSSRTRLDAQLVPSCPGQSPWCIVLKLLLSKMAASTN